MRHSHRVHNITYHHEGEESIVETKARVVLDMWRYRSYSLRISNYEYQHVLSLGETYEECEKGWEEGKGVFCVVQITLEWKYDVIMTVGEYDSCYIQFLVPLTSAAAIGTSIRQTVSSELAARLVYIKKYITLDSLHTLLHNQVPISSTATQYGFPRQPQ
jgi:hypothetical protein